MKAVWENSYDRLIQAIYTEDSEFVLLYGPTQWQGVLNSLKMAVEKVSNATKVYRIEDELGVIVGFAIVDHVAGSVVEAHIRPHLQSKAMDFYSAINDLIKTGSNYRNFILDQCVDSCAFIQATTQCNFVPIEFRVRNGVLEYRYTWSNTWTPILDVNTIPPAQPKQIELRKFGSKIQWRYVGTGEWFDLYDIEDFAGEEWDSVRIPVTADGQVSFPNIIPVAIPDAEKKNTLLFVNGQKRYYPQDYSIVGNSFNWLDTDFRLKTTFEIDLYYKKP